jgi:hypothetical protein
VTYEAVYFATAMERFGVFKRDRLNDRCSSAVFVYMGGPPVEGMDLPEGWSFERGWRGPLEACDDLDPWTHEGVVHASGASGSGVWDMTLCDIEVDLTLEFVGELSERLQAAGLESGWGGCDE